MRSRILYSVIVLIFSTDADAQPTVRSKLGNVYGAVDISTGVPVETFLGIPFAKPPIGERRFARPHPFGAFGELDATKHSPVCVQSIHALGANSSEDCLYLNVFRKEGPLYQTAELPVIIVIHGGAFASGGASTFSFSGVPLAAHTGAVVVTIQYRLGIIGFAQSDTIPANLGLQDQRLAIQWVHDNIASYGGSPERVTLMGPSAGSMSISSHIMSPELRDRNLFQSVIMDGGVLGGIVVPKSETVRRLVRINAKLGCPLSGQPALRCIRDVKVQDLIEYSIESPKAATTFIPTDDESDYRPKNKGPGQFAPVRMLIGTAENEGEIFVKTRIDEKAEMRNFEDFLVLCRELRDLFDVKVDIDNPDTRELLRKSYYEKHENFRIAAAEFVGDSVFVCPVNEFVERFSKFNGEVYVYRFDRQLAQTYKKLHLDPQGGAKHWHPYVHFSGSLLTLGPFAHSADVKFSLDSLKMISDFVAGKSPSFRGLPWPAFPETGEILVFDETPSRIYGLPKFENCPKLLSAVPPKKIGGVKEEL
ncbi:acetylcholinesterase [Galendromus occidentalis]|uniref:Acetylcholinesterase n=1 Tax=Galendromus occidentalis TaxID=34638 RepID=A0AAJ6VZF5_9ACAR|nr:acetylcholinesterase [Galendromus occidentalis]